MSDTTPAKEPAQEPAPDRSTAAGEQRYQQQKIAELDQAVADGTVVPEEPPHPLSWG
ncbi:hypothetical protein [Actinomadura citrea]|uniref:Uncharacterized protein n=1 Tax=Actinomadura citrea TaxID=46158 RepID=A0A7Y9G9R6_9ACTN|nr:hypothetical protein [Actinomadura citrea]NYE12491.1 hypothetical protein [Actinomadura citrea]GGT52363.1 hypothetical protein GCM10010177_05470 [Actinomadura citrea]